MQVLIAGILGFVGAKDDAKPNKCLVSIPQSILRRAIF